MGIERCTIPASHGLKGRAVRRELKTYAAGLTTSGASPANLAQFREQVRQAFPGGQVIEQLLAEWATAGALASRNHSGLTARITVRKGMRDRSSRRSIQSALQ